MKTKTRYHAEMAEIINKPGKFVVIRQWTENGALTTDDNNGAGFDRDQATALVIQHNSKGRSCPTCRPSPKAEGP